MVPSKHIGMSDSDLEKFRPTEVYLGNTPDNETTQLPDPPPIPAEVVPISPLGIRYLSPGCRLFLGENLGAPRERLSQSLKSRPFN